MPTAGFLFAANYKKFIFRCQGKSRGSRENVMIPFRQDGVRLRRVDFIF